MKPVATKRRFFSRQASAKLLGVVIAVIIALLLPPSFMPGLIAVVTVLMLCVTKPKERLTAWLLLVCVLLVKNVWMPWPWTMVVMAALIFGINKKWATTIGLAAVGAAWVWAIEFEVYRPLLHVEHADGLVVCVGDSWTKFWPGGINQPSPCYPDILAKKIRLPVVNKGRPGADLRTIRTGFEKEVLELKPQVVILEVGGHDQLGGVSRKDLAEGLSDLVLISQQAGAFVIIWEIPADLIHDPNGGVYRQVAYEYETGFIPDTVFRRFILQRSLTVDGLHPNEKGQELMAETVASYLAGVVPKLRSGK